MFFIVFRLWEGELRDRRGVMGARIQHKFDFSILIDPAAILILILKKLITLSAIVKQLMHKGLLDIVFYVYTYIRSELVGFNLFPAYYVVPQ